MKKYGYPAETWFGLKSEIRTILINVAKSANRTITYSGLTEKIVTVNLVPNSEILSAVLTEISKEEDASGRGMLSAVVIRKDGDKENGFIEVAAGLGRDVTDPEKCWNAEIDRVCEYWSAHGTQNAHLR